MTDDLAAQIHDGLIGKARFTRADVAEAAGVPLEFAERLWRALGFATPGDDDVDFGERDVDALRLVGALRATGLIPDDHLLTLTRTMAQSLSRLAVSHLDLVDAQLTNVPDDALAAVLAPTMDVIVPSVSALLDYVWRRHLAAGAPSVLTHEASNAALAVGFADLNGFTELSRELTETQLSELVETFEASAATLVTEHNGRVVKTLGDEVMYVATDLAAAAEIGLSLAALDGGLPPVSVGFAYGPVVSRVGDVFGPTVNIAARLTSLARPASVLIDRDAAHNLRELAAYDVSPLRRRTVRGYANLAPYLLRRAAP